ncbi:ClpP/crotonase [Cadophora sp. DSE1049]|nr:ClpP/crotonase [Cadophora sp. DSE1049]
MQPSPNPINIPTSYETLPTTTIKLSHHPAGSPTATPVIIVTLNRPKNGNAFTVDMMHDFEKIYPMFDVDERVKVVVLTGAGKMFCAGADLDVGFKNGEERVMDHRDGGGRLALAIYRCRKPTIVALQGSAVGLGMTMTLPAAIRIAYEGGKYGFVFARRGITMESMSSYFLPRLIGHSRAIYLLTTGLTYPPNSPHFGHLFQETLPKPEQVLPRALELADDIAQNVSPLAGYLNRELLWRTPGTVEETHLLDSAVLYHMFGNPDQKEGVGAFFEKRKPNFKATLEEHGPPFFPWWTEVDTGSRPKAGKSQSKL